MALIDNLVSYYKLDETEAGDAIDAHGSNDGTNTNATINQPGLINTSYGFNGSSSKVDLGTPMNNDLVTVSAWVNIDSVASSAEQGLVNNVEGAGYGLFYSSNLNNN